MYQITLPPSMRRWTIHLAGDEAVFVRASLAEDYPLEQTLPRIWDGHGLGLPEHDVPGFTSALGEVMKTPTFWRAYRGPGRRPAQGWGEPHTDLEDGFVYVSGPCEDLSELVGYRPACRFTIALADVRGLRIRLAAYLKNCLLEA